MELELINWLRHRLPGSDRLFVGLGDDAAVLDWAGRKDCVVTVDTLMDGVDFHLAEVDARRVGHKALGANLSDLAAMAARPVAGVVSLCLPRVGGFRLAQELYEGMIPLAERYGLAIAGGDINSWDAPLAISVTLLGETTPRGPLRRSGARVGDAIVVTGAFGGSRLGRHLDVEPRVGEALRLHERYELHAAIDVSDGLALDLGRLTGESGCGALVWVADVPIADAAYRMAEMEGDGRSALEHALYDGEDFELIMAVPEEEAERMLANESDLVRLSIVGRFVAAPGLRQVDADGKEQELAARGYEHRFDDAGR